MEDASKFNSFIRCLLNPCNVVAQLVTSQLVTVDLTLTCFTCTDVLVPSRITRTARIIHSAERIFTRFCIVSHLHNVKPHEVLEASIILAVSLLFRQHLDVFSSVDSSYNSTLRSPVLLKFFALSATSFTNNCNNVRDEGLEHIPQPQLFRKELLHISLQTSTTMRTHFCYHNKCTQAIRGWAHPPSALVKLVWHHHLWVDGQDRHLGIREQFHFKLL